MVNGEKIHTLYHYLQNSSKSESKLLNRSSEKQKIMEGHFQRTENIVNKKVYYYPPKKCPSRIKTKNKKFIHMNKKWTVFITVSKEMLIIFLVAENAWEVGIYTMKDLYIVDKFKKLSIVSIKKINNAELKFIRTIIPKA